MATSILKSVVLIAFIIFSNDLIDLIFLEQSFPIALN